MADIATIAAALGSIKAAADIAKLIKDSGSSLEQAEIKLQIAELISALADAKIEIAGIQSEMIEKDKELKLVMDKLEIHNSVIWEKPYYWTIQGDEKDGPYCQKCYDVDRQLVRLQGSSSKGWSCRSCNSSYFDKNYSPTRMSFVF